MLKSLLKENRRTLALAAPIMAGHVGQMLMGLVDTVMVGRVGVVPLGACAFANTVLSVPFVFGFGVLSAVSVKCAHAHGAGKPSDSAAFVRGGLLLALCLSVPLALLAHVALPHIGVLGQPAEVNAAVGPYFLLCAWSMVPVFLTCVAKNFCEAHGSPWPPFWIMIAGVGLNAVLNAVLIFGKFGVPAMGLEGAGLATLLARIATAAGVFAWPALSGIFGAAWPGWAFLRSPLKPAMALAAIGLPSGALHLCEVSGFAVGSLMMGWLGVVPLAAHQIAMICAATTFMVPLGLSQAVSVRVGQARGSGRTDSLRPIIAGGLSLALGVMSLFVVVFVLGGRLIASAFISDPAVIALTVQLLMLAGVFQIFDGIQVVSAGTLRGFEDTRIPMLIGVIAYWAVALPVSYVSAFRLGLGAPGVWVGFVIGLAVAAVLLLLRVWKKCEAFSPKPPAFSSFPT